MGIDKGLLPNSPVLIKEGYVHHYGRVDIDQHTLERRTCPPYWVVEHHDNAQWFTRFESAQAMQEAVDSMKPSTEYGTPDEQFTEEVISAIAAILQPHVTPFPFWNDPQIDAQVRLIITDSLRRHRAFLQPADPLPTDSPNAQITPAIDRPIRGSEIRSDCTVVLSFIEDAIEAVRANDEKGISLFVEVMDEVRRRSRETTNDDTDRIPNS